jgi:Glycosyltransferase Family 4
MSVRGALWQDAAMGTAPSRPLRLFLLCYHFPPMGTTGTLRPARWVRYLPPDVAVEALTVEHPPEGGGNEALLATIARRVERWEAPLRPRPLQRRLERGLIGAAEGSWRSKALKTWATWLAWIPDRQVAFVDGALDVGTRLMQRRRPDVLLSSSPPHSLHLAAVELARRFDLPLVLDFRDPWTDNPENRWPTALHRAHERRLEARVLREADLVLANTPGNREMLLGSFPALAPERVVVLPNGYDPALREALAAAPRAPRADGRRVVLYAGHVYAGGAGLMDALAALLRLDPSLPRRVLFRFVGSLDAVVAERAQPLIAAGLVEHSPPVPVERVPALIAQCDALLYAVPRAGRHWIPSKLYEDLIARRPVLAVLPRGDAWNVLERAGVATLIEDVGPERVAHELREALARLLDGTLVMHPDEVFIARYDARVQAAQLAGWLRELCGRATPLQPAPADGAA